jgi:hypothetical protein
MQITQRSIPLTTSFLSIVGASRITYIVVLLVGMALCTRGIGQAAAKGLWTHLVTIAGYVLGALALLLGLQGIFRFSVIPLEGVVLLAGILAIMVLKMLLALAYRAM